MSNGVGGRADQIRAASDRIREDARRRRACRPGRRMEGLEGRLLLSLTVAEFQIPLEILNDPQGITTGPDGNLWFAESEAGLIGRITPDGLLTEFPAGAPAGVSLPDITLGPDGNLWFTQVTTDPETFEITGAIGRITVAGIVTRFPIPTVAALGAITSGPDGNLWFLTTSTDPPGSAAVGRITPEGIVAAFPVPTAGSRLGDITSGPDGNLWFTETTDAFVGPDTAPSRIGRITPAGVVTEFPVPGGSRAVAAITAGPDGNLWFTETISGPNSTLTGAIGRITPEGLITEFMIRPGAQPGATGLRGITAGPDGNLWFTESGAIGRITPSGVVTEFATATAESLPNAITAGPDGRLWFTDTRFPTGAIGRITVAGSITEFTIPPKITLDPSVGLNVFPREIANGPDGALYFTAADRIGRITPDGVLGRFDLPESVSFAEDITTGPDGNLWFTDASTPRILRITPSEIVSEFPLPSPDSSPGDITAGPDGNLWFTEIDFEAGKIGRITPGGVITEFALADPLSSPGDITAGPDGNLWFTTRPTVFGGERDDPVGTIGRITPTGRIDQFPLRRIRDARFLGGEPFFSPLTADSITAGPDGNVWFTASGGGVFLVARITPAGRITEFPVPFEAEAITAGPDGNLWFNQATEPQIFGTGLDPGNLIGRITPAGTVNLFRLAPTIDGVDSITAGPDGNLWFLDSSQSKVARLTPPTGLTGSLSVATDRGLSRADNHTNARRPTFTGLARPGSVVRLFARSDARPRPVPLGRAVTNRRGEWRLTASRPLRDGSYAITATATVAARRGGAQSAAPLSPGDDFGPLVIDTRAPRVTDLSFDAASMDVTVTLRDPGAGFGAGEVAFARNLDSFATTRVTKPGAREGLFLFLTPESIDPEIEGPPGPDDLLTLSGRINDPSPQPDDRYSLTVLARSVMDRAGNALDGEFRGVLPSGDGRPGGDFRVSLGAGRRRAPRRPR